MNARFSLFAEACENIRFTLDTPVSQSTHEHRMVADLVARVSSSSLRIQASTVPSIFQTTMKVVERLQIQRVPEVYVQNDDAPNAFAISPDSDCRLVIILNSGIIKLLSLDELQFVIAHELGHFGMKHGASFGSKKQSELSFLNEQSLKRCQEISADRVGLLGCRGIDVAARVILKLASGLPDELLEIDVVSFIRQLDRDPNEFSREWELAMSHPSLPLRLWALLQFSHTKAYNEMSDRGEYGTSLEDVDAKLEDQFDLLGDGRLNKLEEDSYIMALLWSAVSIVMADGVIDKREQVVLRDLVGDELTQRGLEFVSSHGVVGVRKKTCEAIGELRDARVATKSKYLESLRSISNILRIEFEHAVSLLQLDTLD